jgi:hypothetical protein
MLVGFRHVDDAVAVAVAVAYRKDVKRISINNWS